MQKIDHNTIKNHNSKPKWDWMQVDCNLKTETNRKYVLWSLVPSIVLTNPAAQGPDPNVKLYIDTEKSLQFSQELGWNWHKSWNLPNISIRVEIKDISTGQSLLAPKNLYAQLFAVKVVVDPHEKNENAHLVDVGIRGTSKIQMVDGQAYFTAMKFLSTSYNNEGVKFYLLLVIYINNNDNEIPKILTATLSPPIFVDSRKSARDNQQKKYSSFIEPFLVQNLEKQFIKRQNKRKNQNQIKIRNDFQGLFSYLTAPNIRHKVKHPIFLTIKFNNCAKLYFNSNLLSKTTSANQALNILQKKISKDHTSKKSSKSQNKIDDKMFILVIKQSSDSFKNKKIQQAIDPLDCNSLGVIYNEELLPPFFQNICILGNISNAYKQQYSQLYVIAKSIINIDRSDDDNSQQQQSGSQNESDEQQSQSPVPAKKIRFNKKYDSQQQQQSLQKLQNNSQNKKSLPINETNILKKNGINNNNQNIKINPVEQINLNLLNSNPINNPTNNNANNNNLNQNSSINIPSNNIDQLINNIGLSHSLGNLKIQNLYSNNNANLLGLINHNTNNNNNNSNKHTVTPQIPQNDLLSSLIGNNYNPLNNVSNLSAIGGLFGLNSQLNNQLNNQITTNQNIQNNSSNLLSQNIQNNHKIGFSPTIQSQTQNHSQPISLQSQLNNQLNSQLNNQINNQINNQLNNQLNNQINNQIQSNINNNNSSNPNQTNLLLLQQLAMYKQLLNQLSFSSQLGLNFNINSILPGIGQGMQNLSQGLVQNLNQQGLSQSLNQNLGQTLGNGLNNNSIGIGGLSNLNALGLNNLNINTGFGNFGFLQNQISQQNVLKIIQQMQNEQSQKEAKQEQH